MVLLCCITYLAKHRDSPSKALTQLRRELLISGHEQEHKSALPIRRARIWRADQNGFEHERCQNPVGGQATRHQHDSPSEEPDKSGLRDGLRIGRDLLLLLGSRRGVAPLQVHSGHPRRDGAQPARPAQLLLGGRRLEDLAAGGNQGCYSVLSWVSLRMTMQIVFFQ